MLCYFLSALNSTFYPLIICLLCNFRYLPATLSSTCISKFWFSSIFQYQLLITLVQHIITTSRTCNKHVLSLTTISRGNHLNHNSSETFCLIGNNFNHSNLKVAQFIQRSLHHQHILREQKQKQQKPWH